MKQEPSAPPLVDIYTKVWTACLALWPLFWVQFLFALLQYAALFFCLALLFGPFIQKEWGRLSEIFHPGSVPDFRPLAPDAAAYFLNGNWIGIFLGAVLLYALWWIILAALSDGGVFGAWRRYFREQELFSIKAFFNDGFRFLAQMIWLQIILFFLACGLGLGLAMVFLVLIVVLAFLHPGALGIVLLCLFLGLPSLLGLAALGLFWAAFRFICKSNIARGMGAWAAILEAFRNIREDRWRMGTGIGVALLTYLAVSMLARVVFGGLSLVPYLGLLFKLVDVLLGFFLALLLVVYLPSLSMAFLTEKEGDG